MRLLIYMLNTLFAFFDILYVYKKTSMMGQFVDYIGTFWPVGKSSKELSNTKTTSTSPHASPLRRGHVTFADSSFRFGRHEGEKAAKLAAISFANQRTINSYLAIGLVAFSAHLYFVVYPTCSSEEFDYTDLYNYERFSLSCLTPILIYWASFVSMRRVNKPLIEGAKLSSKNSGLELDNNPFITSIKIIVVLTAFCQIISIYHQQLTLLLLLIIPVWCYKLVTKIAQTEYERYQPSPKKQWTDRLNIDRLKSPNKSKTPSKNIDKQASLKKQDDPPKAQQTPRTVRTKRAVNKLFSGVSDKYHAFEQNVSQQLSQGIFQPRSNVKAIESSS